MKRDQPKGTLNKKYQLKVDFKKRTPIKGKFTMKRDQPKETLNKRYHPKVDLKGVS